MSMRQLLERRKKPPKMLRLVFSPNPLTWKADKNLSNKLVTSAPAKCIYRPAWLVIRQNRPHENTIKKTPRSGLEQQKLLLWFVTDKEKMDFGKL